ncbi:MAG: hypothetical protein ACK4TA_03460 [Saprospiraceae bacterium]
MKQAFGIGIVLGILLCSCESEAEKQAKVQQRLQTEADLRVVEYMSVLQKNCQTKVLEEAVRIADSLLVLEARLSTDTLFKPLKPLRPEKPETQILKDTTPIKPFLKPKKDTLKQ